MIKLDKKSDDMHYGKYTLLKVLDDDICMVREDCSMTDDIYRCEEFSVNDVKHFGIKASLGEFIDDYEKDLLELKKFQESLK